MQRLIGDPLAYSPVSTRYRTVVQVYLLNRALNQVLVDLEARIADAPSPFFDRLPSVEAKATQCANCCRTCSGTR